MKHFLLLYTTVPDFIERRAQFRDEHLRLAWEAAERGELLLGGALAGLPKMAALLFGSETSSTAESFARADPYVTQGLVEHWEVREWTTVVGSSAAQPFRPSD